MCAFKKLILFKLRLFWNYLRSYYMHKSSWKQNKEDWKGNLWQNKIESGKCKHSIKWKCLKKKLWGPRQQTGGRYLTPGPWQAKDEHYCTLRWCSPWGRRRGPWWHRGGQGRPSLPLFGQMCVSIWKSLFLQLSGKHHHDHPWKRES